MGRKDSQVQVHGNRVEMTEIEHVLCNYPGVEAAVVIFEKQSLYATVQSKIELSLQELRNFVASQLPTAPFLVLAVYRDANDKPYQRGLRTFGTVANVLSQAHGSGG